MLLEIWPESSFSTILGLKRASPIFFSCWCVGAVRVLGLVSLSANISDLWNQRVTAICEMSMMQRYGRNKSVVKRSKKYLEEALYVKLFKDGGSQLSVRQSLNNFIKTGKRVYKWEVGDTLKKLRDRKLYQPALKVTRSFSLFAFLGSKFKLFLRNVIV